MSYLILAISVIMFGVQFFCNDQYQRLCGSKLAATMRFIAGSSFVGAVILFSVNKFTLSATPFTLLMALFTALNALIMIFCSAKALGKTNLSMYSLFSMLGGMALPFAAGLIFFGEDMTVGKGICLVTVFLSLLLTVERKGSSSGGGIYCCGIFVFNGMSGVLSTIYREADFAKTPVEDYSVWSALMTVVIAIVILLFLKRDGAKTPAPAYGWMAGYGVLNKVANFLLLVSLTLGLDASIQYPMVTGGVMIVSTLLSYFTPKKPGRREYAALALSLVGIVMLVVF